MNLEDFDKAYVTFKGVDQIQIACDCPSHAGPDPVLGKTPARRNILKNGGERFICRRCFYNDPILRAGTGQPRQTDELITVRCPHQEHDRTGKPRERQIKKSAWFGLPGEPFEQVCKSCAQTDKVITEQQKKAISEKLTGRSLAEDHRRKISKYMKTNEEGIARGKANLIPGMGGIARAGLPLPPEWREAISQGTKGKPKTRTHAKNISEGRKKMLADAGGFTREHREKISRATVVQFEQGFEPKLHHLKGWHESAKAGRIYHRSSYEKRAFMLLDDDSAVRTYWAEKVKVYYYNPKKDITSTYIIDLHVEYIDDSVKMIEVKPEKWLNDEVIIAKTEAAEVHARELGLVYEVWSEPFLFDDEKHMRHFCECLRSELLNGTVN